MSLKITMYMYMYNCSLKSQNNCSLMEETMKERDTNNEGKRYNVQGA